ncbi:hypothetical protein HNR42_000183 [Deinobacterium chartae]|uniref:Peptidase M16C associated domain-containing protein n=1 Tax=Deinobacterium chartae TaxID=521158 RepID=A0A841HTM8_9DEIO|nr:insulinase family protein [Deinobacterium chartae]MBB6096771.1 hypothetical protein [Deinobacterium chartae]
MDPFNPGLSEGTRIGGYRLVRSASLPELQAHLYEFEHETGARHVHISRDDDNLTFSVLFPTVPQDSTGVAHILEHIVLSGSRKYPLGSPFFAMLPRSLNTFMNAFTAADWTMYPYSTRNVKDFDNLLQVYLDAVFFPNLTEWSFKREAHRLEFATPSDPSSQLTLQGVVYNEMKGAMATPAAVMGRLLGKALYPDLTYANNSGGAPANIPELTWEGLRAFHARHYHPSNAYFYTYGNRPVASVLERIEELALREFTAIEVDTSIPDQPGFAEPREVRERYPSSETERKAQVLVAWKSVPSFDTYATLQMSVLEAALLGNAASPLRKALIDSGLGSTLASGSGLNTNYRESAFAVGLKDVDAGDAERIETLILGTLRALAENGVDPESVDSALHRIELSRKEVSNAGFPYSLKLFFAFAGSWLHGGDPLRALQFDEDLERLARERAAGGLFERLIREQLLDNPHRVRIVLEPDPKLAAEQEAAEAARIAQLAEGLDETGRARIVADALKLAELQERQDDLSVLPTLEVSDIPADVPRAEYRVLERGGAVVGLCPQPTNGLVYVDLQLDFAGLSEEQLDLLPFYAFALTRSGAAGRDYLELARRIDAVTGGVSASVGVSTAPDNLANVREHFTLSGKALARNAMALLELLRDLLAEPQFDPARLEQLVKQQRAAMQSGIVGSGNQYAGRRAAAQLRAASAIGERLSGLTQLATLKRLEAEGVRGLVERFAEITRALRAAPARVCVTAEEGELALLEGELDTLLSPLTPAAPVPGHAPTLLPRVRDARTTDVPVSYNAKAFATVPFVHPDAPALSVLASLLRANFLLRELREKGGAYGGSATCDAQGGIFLFWSYRDPHVARTYRVYRDALAYLEGNVGEREVREAILSASAALDPLTSPDTLGRMRFFGDQGGYTPEVQAAFKSGLLATTLEDLRRVARAYLADDGRAAYATVVGADVIARANAELEEPFEVASI